VVRGRLLFERLYESAQCCAVRNIVQESLARLNSRHRAEQRCAPHLAIAVRNRSTPRARSWNFPNAIVSFAISRIFEASSTFATALSTLRVRLNPTVSQGM
jgi:hypothetical protein